MALVPELWPLGVLSLSHGECCFLFLSHGPLDGYVEFGEFDGRRVTDLEEGFTVPSTMPFALLTCLTIVALLTRLTSVALSTCLTIEVFCRSLNFNLSIGGDVSDNGEIVTLQLVRAMGMQ